MLVPDRLQEGRHVRRERNRIQRTRKRYREEEKLGGKKGPRACTVISVKLKGTDRNFYKIALGDELFGRERAHETPHDPRPHHTDKTLIETANLHHINATHRTSLVNLG